MTDKRPFTIALLLARLMSGFVGGLSGTLALFIVFFIFNSLLPATAEATSLSVFAVVVMAFVGTLTANVASALMVTFVDSQKYSRRKTTLIHVFMFNLIFFFLAIPFYLLGASLNIVNAIAGMHLILSAFISFLLMEIVAGYEYSLLAVYSAGVGILLGIGLTLMAIYFELNLKLLMFLAMPIVWILLEMSGGIMELIYDIFVHFYGVEALSVKTDLGGDLEKEPEEDNSFEEGVDREEG